MFDDFFEAHPKYKDERINKLTYALGLALGALEVIDLNPHSFNSDGVKQVIIKLREIQVWKVGQE